MLKTSDAKASLPAKAALLRRLEDKSARIAVLGAGYVGLPLALRFAEVGFATLAIDIDAEKVAALNAGRSYIRTIPDEAVAQARENGLAASDEIARVTEADALVLCVPTPLNPYREPDLQYVTGTLETIGPHLRAGHVLSLESTTWPGTTSEVLAPRLKEHGFAVGEDVFLVYSPEREDPGNARFTTKTIPKLVGGETPACLDVGMALYRGIVDRVVSVSSPQVAEMTKLLENIHRAVNIGLVNEMKVVADRMGIDIREVIDAAATKPFGFTPYYPGPGIGGHCIPVDPFYLTWKAREYGLHTRFIELAGEINAGMPAWVAAKAADALNARGKPLKGAKVLMLGIAYKKNIGDCRESPAVRIMEILREKGAELSYADPFVPAFPKMREHHFDLTAVEPTAETLASADVAVLATDHDAFDYEMIRKHCPLVVDTRGVYREGGENIVKA